MQTKCKASFINVCFAQGRIILCLESDWWESRVRRVWNVWRSRSDLRGDLASSASAALHFSDSCEGKLSRDAWDNRTWHSPKPIRHTASCSVCCFDEKHATWIFVQQTHMHIHTHTHAYTYTITTASAQPVPLWLRIVILHGNYPLHLIWLRSFAPLPATLRAHLLAGVSQLHLALCKADKKIQRMHCIYNIKTPCTNCM